MRSGKNDILRSVIWGLRAIPLIACMLLAGCNREDDNIIYTGSRHWTTKKVAVIAPLGDPIMKARLERTARWMQENLHQAQLHDTICIDLKLEWYDEYGNDLNALGMKLAASQDIMAVIGPFDSENVALLAPWCHNTGKPLILPTATSENLIRRFAITSTDNGQQPFMWSLTETDISLSEVMLSLYANFTGLLTESWIKDLTRKAALFTPRNLYGQTFYEWAPFQAEELGIGFGYCYRYTDNTTLLDQFNDYYEMIENSIADQDGDYDPDEEMFEYKYIPSFIVVQDIEQLYQIARLRSWRFDYDPDDPEMDEYAIERVTWSPAFYALSDITDEGIAALGPRGAALTSGYQGFSPYADPRTGFEMSYETRFDTKPTFSECKFYDALLLSAFAASYMEHHTDVTDFNRAVIDITTTDNILSGPAWSQTGMELYLSALEQGRLLGFNGASGTVQFDSECYTAALNTTYVNWVLDNGHIRHQSYYSTQGNAQTSQTLASWNWLVNNAEERFDSTYSATAGTMEYPPLTDQYAVLIQCSNGWQNYRHESDVLNIYQMLKSGGYDDDHIILIIADDVAQAPQNKDWGAVRTDPDGANLRQGAVIDYNNADLNPADIADILKGNRTESTPIVLPKDSGQNVLLFCSGHGHSVAAHGVNEIAWRNAPIGQGITADMLAQTLRQMADSKQFRQMLVCLEPCFSANIGMALEGIPGVLAICAASAYEQSFADSWSNELGVWMCDRFSRNLVGYAASKPDCTYRDLYLYCAQHTLGSHVAIFNYLKFGNLYTTGPEYFFIKQD